MDHTLKFCIAHKIGFNTWDGIWAQFWSSKDLECSFYQGKSLLDVCQNVDHNLRCWLCLQPKIISGKVYGNLIWVFDGLVMYIIQSIS